jgi:protein-tyrosine phosphatase
VSALNDRKRAPTWEPGPGVIRLADGRRIRARGVDETPAPEPLPDFGLYLLAHRPPTVEWEQRWLPWRNYWLPRRRRETVTALVETFARSATQRVEVACEAGTGRTGTALACLAVLAGTAPEDAIPYVRYRYDDRAVRAPWQRWFVRWFARHAAAGI